MSAYFNTVTQEYPLYPGDMQLRFADFDEANPPEGYVMVPDVNPPEFDGGKQYLEELLPILIDGVWIKQFIVHDLTQEQINAQDALTNAIKSMYPRQPSNDAPGSAPNVIE